MKTKLVSIVAVSVITINLILAARTPATTTLGPTISYIDTQTSTTCTSIYYMAKNGLDSNPGTQAQPWLTFQKAVTTMVAGDTLYIRAGVYNEGLKILNKLGTNTQHITFKNYPNEKAIIDGTGLGSQGAVYINNSSYITIDGLEIRNTASAGVQASYGENHYLEFLNMTVHDCGSSSFTIGYNSLFGKVTDVLISGCNVYNLCKADGSDSGIAIISVDSFEIKNSRIADTRGEAGVEIKAGCTNGKIHHNEFVRTCLYIDAFGQPTSNIDLYDNYFHDAPEFALFLGCEERPTTETNINVYNNLFYNNHRGCFVAYGEAGGFTTLTFSFVNNTCYQNAGSGWTDIIFGDATGNYNNCIIANNIIVCATSNTPPIMNIYPSNGGTTIDHNIFYCAGGTLYPESTEYPRGTNPILTDPLW